VGVISGFAAANPTGEIPPLSMPLEHVNYTLTTLNGEAWAVIDGEYPISIQTAACNFDGYLPMLYPMPPGTTHIHVYLDDTEVDWSKYTQNFPDALHQTALGAWGMIYAPLTVSEDDFTLKIHYEHPLQTANASTLLFLYDLNISPYLTPEKPESTCIFTVRGEGNFSGLQVYTAPPESVPIQWKPLNYTTTQDENGEVLTITMHSTYEQFVGEGLPGDLVVAFSAADAYPSFRFGCVDCFCGLPLWLVYPKNATLNRRGIEHIR
jgi:hypothetical protein